MRSPDEICSDVPDRGAGEALQRVDAVISGAAFVGQVLVYSALLYAAHASPLGAAVLTGFLIADVLLWVVGAVFELSRQRLVMAVELAFYLLVAWLWSNLSRSLSLPEDPELRALAILTGITVLGARGSLLARRLLRDDE